MKITLGELRNLISESLKDQDTNEPDPLWDFYKYTFKVRTELSNPYNLEIINTFRDIYTDLSSIALLSSAPQGYDEKQISASIEKIKSRLSELESEASVSFKPAVSQIQVEPSQPGIQVGASQED